MSEKSKKEKFLSFNTLACLLQAIQGRYTTIELRNECVIHGLLLHVDGYMNAFIEDAKLVTPEGAKKDFKQFFVKGEQIRFVQIPPDVDAVKSVEVQLAELGKQPQQKAMPLTRRAATLLQETRDMRAHIRHQKQQQHN